MNSIKNLVDEIVGYDKKIEELKSARQKVESKLQQEALQEMEQRKVKTVQYFGTDNNYVLVTKANKVDLISYKDAKKVFGDNIEDYITVDDEPKYKLNNLYKAMASAAFNGKVEDKSVRYVLEEMGLQEGQIKLCEKKLKGDYLKDRKLLESLGVKECDTWIFFLYDALIGEQIAAALTNAGYEKGSGAYKEALEDMKKSVIVEDITKITVKYEK